MAPEAAHIHPDLMVRTAEGDALLVAELRRGSAVDDPAMREQLQAYASKLQVPFGMLIDDDSILIVRNVDGQLAWDRQVRLSTRQVLASYSENLEPSRVEAFYLTSLIQAWLRDFAMGWHSTVPPGSDAFRALGLVERLRDADVVTEVAA